MHCTSHRILAFARSRMTIVRPPFQSVDSEAENVVKIYWTSNEVKLIQIYSAHTALLCSFSGSRFELRDSNSEFSNLISVPVFFCPCTVRINSLLRSAPQNIKINPTADISQLHFHAHTLYAWKVASANLVDSSNISSSSSFSSWWPHIKNDESTKGGTARNQSS